MSKNMSSTNEEFESAQKKYNDLLNQYTGNAGYQNSLNQAGKGAAIESQAAGAQVQSQARQSGMTKAQAAAMGANSASEQYGKSFSDQQSKAADQGTNAVTNQQSAVSNEQTEGNNRYNRAWGNVGGIAQGVGGAIDTATKIIPGLSDATAKTAISLTHVPSKGSEYGNMVAAKQAKDYHGDDKDEPKAESKVGETLKTLGSALTSFRAPSVTSDEEAKVYDNLTKVMYKMKPRSYKDLIWKKEE